MLFNETDITIRERGKRELFDLALHVGRRHFFPLAACLVVGVAPFAAFNLFALRSLPGPADPETAQIDGGLGAWYVVYQTILVFLEAPLATAPMTAYLGQVLFMARPNWRQTLRDLWRALPQLLRYQLIVRGTIAALVAAAVTDWQTDNSFAQFVIWTTVIVVLCVRGVRPYLGEVILLERNPRRAVQRGQMTTGRRNAALHAGFTGDTLGQMLASAMIGGFGAFSTWILLVWLRATFFNRPDVDFIAIVVFVPAALWAVSGFLAIVRFLGYLDLRIRREGWEVELRIRAEAEHLSRAGA